MEILLSVFGLKGKAILEKALGEVQISLVLTNWSMVGLLLFLVVCSVHRRNVKLM